MSNSLTVLYLFHYSTIQEHRNIDKVDTNTQLALSQEARDAFSDPP